MNTDYRYQFPDNPSLSVNNMPLLRDKDGLLNTQKSRPYPKPLPNPCPFLFLAG